MSISTTITWTFSITSDTRYGRLLDVDGNHIGDSSFNPIYELVG